MVNSIEWNAEIYHRISNPQFEWGLKVLARCELRGDEHVMDAGCGTGRLTAALLERLPQGRVTAVDLSSNMLESARQSLQPSFGKRVRFAQADLGRLAFDEEFDGIFSTAAFHWVKDHAALFRGLFRALDPGGWLEAQCGGGPNLARIRVMANRFMDSSEIRPFFANWEEPWEYADAETTKRRMEEAGFAKVETWLEPAPLELASEDAYREYLASIVFHRHLAPLPQHYKGKFLDAIVGEGHRQLDYWRLNLRGKKPA
ncbi:MAG TPA: methyltransferase domain-containing protein [Terriglobales bacterium]|nr:methyltransferase domain-containing protein [Terriglobales bacterium]